MKAGVLGPWWVEGYGYKAAVEVATTAEELGYDVVWFADHVAVPASHVGHLRSTWFEVLTLLSNLAARTHRIRLGTNVLVAPYRHPLLSAKMLATVDVVSGGRLVVGVGSGFLEDEFTALGAPRFADRGTYTDECIAVWKEAWREGTASFSGRHLAFADVAVDPPPVQRPHPPIWIGNLGPHVLRRVAALGDGWHPVGLSIAGLRDGAERLETLCRERGRTERPAISYGGNRAPVTRARVPEAGRDLLAGGVEQVRDDLRRLEAVGCDNVVFRLGTGDDTVAAYLAQLVLVATQVLPP